MKYFCQSHILVKMSFSPHIIPLRQKDFTKVYQKSGEFQIHGEFHISYCYVSFLVELIESNYIYKFTRKVANFRYVGNFTFLTLMFLFGGID